jgi:transglutaminase-like putative cysteine protease
MDELKPTAFIDSDHEAVREFAAKHSDPARSDRDNAVALYYAIRDDFRYDPYSIDLTLEGLRASHVLEIERGWCVTKSNLLAACCRALGIAARVGYADVRNHLSTARMRERLGTDLFIWHGYTSIRIEGDWVKATPAFNLELCEKFRLKPLEFDGREDSIYHPFDLDGKQHMEYVTFRGEFADVPLEAMLEDMARVYPHLMESMSEGDFDREVAQETA